ncbi:MAG: ABC transporter ATP-binding protein [Chloroflexaceae bacterium]|nr:ABC transporter ATP-binding protein [Chloroflexaceae bacterium]
METSSDPLSAPSLNVTPEPMPVVQTEQLSKIYRTGFWLNQKVVSLKDCSLTVYHGETFGLLGPNGAGKTTLLKILLGILRPSCGRGILLGYPLGDRSVRSRLGYLPENAYYYDYLTAWEFLDFTAGLFEMPRALRAKRIPELLDLVGLARSIARKKQLRKFSKGMLQRIGLAQALINDPELVFLDEPMSGLDPMGRYLVREIIQSLKAQGKTIFFNSHILADVEQICDRIALLGRGELICIGSLEEVLGAGDSYQAIVKGGRAEVWERWLVNPTVAKNLWHGQIDGNVAEFVAAVSESDAELISLRRARLSLEDFFVQQMRKRGIER